MDALFSPQYQWLWTLALGLALLLPVRNMIWVLQVRRAQKKLGEDVDEPEKLRLKKRALATSALLCFLFAVAYIQYLFQGQT